jgi:cell division control protein 11
MNELERAVHKGWVAFLTTFTNSLREIDIELMRRLSPRVNVIPVIGRADSLTPQELTDFKKRIIEDIEHYNIPIYNFPFDIEEDDEDTVEENSELRVRLGNIGKTRYIVN